MAIKTRVILLVVIPWVILGRESIHISTLKIGWHKTLILIGLIKTELVRLIVVVLHVLLLLRSSHVIYFCLFAGLCILMIFFVGSHVLIVAINSPFRHNWNSFSHILHLRNQFVHFHAKLFMAHIAD